MPIHITTQDDLSLSDLLWLKSDGYSVAATPHIGNVTLRVLALGHAGFNLKFVDTNTGSHDKICHPHRLIRERKPIEICNPNTISSLATVSSNYPDLGLRRGDSVKDIHLNAIRRALPNASLCTDTWYLNRHYNSIGALEEIVTYHNPELWTHHVGHNGEPGRIGVSDWKRRRALGIFGITHNDHGLIIPNILMLLFEAIVESMRTGGHRVYFMAGETMAGYIGSLGPKLTSLYDLVRRENPFKSLLPEHLNVVVVQTSNCRFASPLSQKHLLDDVLHSYTACMKFVDSAASCMDEPRGYTPTEENRRVRDLLTSDGIKSASSLVQHALWRYPHMLYDTSRKNFVTQHDLEINNERLYVPREIYSKTICELQRIMSFFREISSGNQLSKVGRGLTKRLVREN